MNPNQLVGVHETVATLDASYARLQGCSGQDANHGHSHLVPVPQGFRMVAFGEYDDDETASTMKSRDYKDATDLVVDAIAFAENSRAEVRLENVDGSIAGALSTGGGKAGQGVTTIAFTCKDYGGDASEDLAPTMRSMGHDESHANGGGQLAVAYRVHGENSSAMTSKGSANVADPVEVARCLDTTGGYSTNQGGNVVLQPEVCITGDVAHTLTAEGFDASEDGAGRGTPIVNAPSYGFNWQNGGGYGKANDGLGVTFEATGPLQRCNTPAVASRMAVRRLTPVECARLQGFPDNHCRIPTAKMRKLEDDMVRYLAIHHPDLPDAELRRLAADGPQYKAYGNSWAVACTRWIGRRIDSRLRQCE